MRKLLVAVVGTLLLTGVAFAQTDADASGDTVSVTVAPQEGTDFDTTQNVGASIPFPLGVHYTIENAQLFGATPDLRISLSGNFLNTSLNLGVDALFTITQLDQNIVLYGGPGLQLGTVFPVNPNIGLVGLLGGEYRFNREIGFFAELGSSINISSIFSFQPRGQLGFNYHF